MGHENVEQRRAQIPQEPDDLCHDIVNNPYLSVAVGLGIGTSSYLASTFVDGSFFLLTMAPVAPAAVLMWRGIHQFQRQKAQPIKPGSDNEKQLLTAILEIGGRITPIEAALKTSLSVDEAEYILSRLASHGHLLIESQGVALYYTLPGRDS